MYKIHCLSINRKMSNYTYTQISSLPEIIIYSPTKRPVHKQCALSSFKDHKW